WCEVEQVPDRLESADMAGVLTGVRGRVEELGAPEVANRLAVAVEDVQHGSLVLFRSLGEVVAVVAVGGRGQQPQPSPAALLGKGEDAWQRGLRDDRQVDLLRGVLGGALELVDESDARRARAFRERRQPRPPSHGAARSPGRAADCALPGTPLTRLET